MTERPRLERAAQLEGLVRQWKEQLRTSPPTSDEERRHYRDKAAEFGRLADAQLANLAAACTQAGNLANAIGQDAPQIRVAALHELGVVLDGEAATARALASVQEICFEIDRVT